MNSPQSQVVLADHPRIVLGTAELWPFRQPFVRFLRWAQLCCEGLSESVSFLQQDGSPSSICEQELCFTLKSAGCRLVFFKVPVESMCGLPWSLEEKYLCL